MSAETAPLPPLRGHVLVADDNPVNQRIILTQLSRLGLTADGVDNGTDAIAAVKRQAYDVVLMDCQMPQCNGRDATVCIRQHERDCHAPRRLPIIAITAGDSAAEQQACRDAGMDAILVKPVRREALSSVLSQWLSSANQTTDAPLVDAAALRLLRDDAGDLTDYVELFRSEITRQTAACQAALAAGDGQALFAAAHRLKGSSRLLGAARLTQRLLALEEAAQANDLSRCQALLADFAALSENSCAAVQQLSSQLA